MNKSNKLLSDIVTFRTYAKYIPNLNRREVFEETVNRCMTMHLDKFPKLSKEIIKAFSKVHSYEIMPSMRSLQFAGSAIVKNNLRSFNCSYCEIDNTRVFSEILYLLLSGCGVGYSVQSEHIKNLPKVGRPIEDNRFIIHDSIAGWSQALQELMDAYFFNGIRPIFDYTPIRARGSYLSTTGAKAPGPEPLKAMLEDVEARLKRAEGRKLTSLEIHDIICVISDCVLAGGIRRSALIALFDKRDNEMLTCKHGEWWIKNPQRARANNSAILHRDHTNQRQFMEIFEMCKESKAGEPGFKWGRMGTNPCAEIALNSNQLCNLTTINQTGIANKKEFLSRVYSATLIGTLQASYTDFPYVSQKWKEVTEREALLGVSFTGIADNKIPVGWLQEGAKLAKEVNEKYSKKIGINPAARITTVKPEGSASAVLGSSSGIHARHSQHYLRRIRMNADDALVHYLKNTIPELVEEDRNAPNTMVVTIPQESPKGSILRENESALQLLKRVLKYNKHWIHNGHREGDDHHNVSCTISVRDNEWKSLAKTLWEKRLDYNAVSLLPYDGGTYQQAPFETCTKEVYEQTNALVKEIDLKKVYEEEDNTELVQTVACGGGFCEIT